MKQDEARYTVIQHTIRIKAGLSCNEYVIADSVHKLSSNPKHPVCTAGQPYFASFLGLTVRSIINIMKKLKEKGYIEKVLHDDKFMGWRSTDKWYKEFVIIEKKLLTPEESSGDEEPSGGSEKSSPRHLKKVQGTPEVNSSGGEESSGNKNDITTDSNIDKQQLSGSLFNDLKISKTDRQKLMSKYPSGRIREVIDASSAVESFKTSREAWILSALKENWDVRSEKDRREDKRRQQRQEEEEVLRQRALEEEQNRARDAAILEWIKNNPLQFAGIMREEQEKIPEALKGSGGEATHLKAIARARVGRILEGEDLSGEVEESESAEETPNSPLGWQVRGVGA